jgi:uncharacterized coiled-coil protein SlyX
MSETPTDQGAHPGRTHIAPQKGDSIWYKAKVIAPIASLLVVVISATWAFTAYDKRITVLEVSDAGQARQLDILTNEVATIQQWVPTVDLKLALLLQHFGISVPKP